MRGQGVVQEPGKTVYLKPAAGGHHLDAWWSKGVVSSEAENAPVSVAAVVTRPEEARI